MNTLEQFKEDVLWSMLELSDNEVENIYNSVDDSTFKDIEELENEFDEDTPMFWDVNLISVLEHYEELVQQDRLHLLGLYYLPESEVYAGVLFY